MTVSYNLSPVDSGLILSKGVSSNPLAKATQNAGTYQAVSTRQTQYTHTLDEGAGAFHNPTSVDKEDQEPTLSKFPVNVLAAYKKFWVLEDDWEDGVAMTNKLKAQGPGAVNRTITQAAINGTSVIPTSPFPVVTKEVVFDGTKAQAQAAFDAVRASGHRATAMILNYDGVDALKNAIVEGTTTSPFTINVVDGFIFNGVPVYVDDFPTIDGVIGQIGAYDRTAFYAYKGVKTSIYDPATDSVAGTKNSYGVKFQWWVGFGASDADLNAGVLQNLVQVGY